MSEHNRAASGPAATIGHPGGASPQLADRVEAGPLILRRFRDEDADDLTAGCADPVTQRFLPNLPRPYTPDDARWWITEGSVAAFANGGAAYAFADPATDRLLGGGGFAGIHFGATEMGYWVAPWARGRGLGTAAAKAMTAQAMAHGAQRVVVRTAQDNPASQRVALAAGFSREGVQRGGGQARDGGRYDVVVWARLAGDPDRATVRLLPDLPGRGPDGPGSISDGVVTLRPIGPADVDDTFALRSLPDVIATSVPAEPPGRAKIERQCGHAESAWLAGERADLAIVDAATGAYAGEIGLYYFEPGTQQAMIGYSMLPAWRGRGFATRAARLIARWAFEHTDIVRVIAGTAPDNLGSQRVLERAGFIREGYQRARLPGPGGSRIDDILYALLADQI
ncbi:MAG TPA: GNAT family N-acetyltransferase [Micromonosporaceae bacterium]